MTPKVLIAVPTGEFARRADFYDYFHMLQRPDNTIATFAHGSSPAKNRNIMINLALENECSHILFIDDDMTFPADGLTRLLAHDKDIVGGLYLHRNYPHFPVMFDEWYPDGRCKYAFLDGDKKDGLLPVVNMGLGFCLIKTDVFKKLEEPYIRLGQLDKDQWNDDIEFFNRCRQAGFDMFIDLDVKCGHMMTAIIMPHLTENGWMTLYNTNSVESFQVPQIAPTPEEELGQKRKAGVLPNDEAGVV